MNFIERFLEHCNNDANYVAIVDNDGKRETTYGELYAKSKKIAKKLISLGVKKNDNVIISLPKCMEYMASIYGVIFAGGCYVPLSENYAVERKKYIINEVGAEVVIDEDFIKDIDTFDMIENINVGLDQNISIVYTSGSSGTPKGVIFGVENVDIIAKRCESVAKTFEHNSQLYIAQFYFSAHVLTLTQLSFDEPATLHLILENKAKDFTYVVNYLNEHKIDYLFILPSVAKFLGDVKYLKAVLVGGEKVENIYSDKFKIISIYAQAEGAVFSHEVRKKSNEAIIGKPACGFTLKIFDDDGNEVKKGEIGEICGIGKFAKGYYKDEKLTKNTFIKLPDGNTLLHTNDMGYINENDDLVYVARKGDLLKIAGKRVEPGEIENVIKNISGIDKCVVKNVQINNINKICAFYTTKDKTFISGNKIIESICKKLPLYMIPNSFIYKDVMPVNINGKIDKISLNIDEDIDVNKDVELAENELEKIIIDAFKKVLGENLNIGRNDDFFFLGGNSILAMKLTNILSNHGVGFQDIYINRTPEKIAAFCKKYDDEVLEKENELALKNDQSLTKYKKMLIYGYMLNPKKQNGTIVPMVLEMKKNVFDLEKLSKSAYEVFKSHPAIGSVIIPDEKEKFKLRYKPEIITPIEIINLKDDDIADYVLNLSYMENIIDAPNYRCKIVSTEKSDYFIFIQLHAFTDEYSLNLLFRQVVAHYIDGKAPKKDYYYLYLKRIYNMYMLEENQKLIGEISANINNADYDDNIRYDFDIVEKEAKTISYRFDTKQTLQAINLYAKNMKVSPLTIYIATLLKTIVEYNGTKKAKCQFLYNGRDEKFKNDIYGGFVNSIVALADFNTINSNEELLKIIEKQNYTNYLQSDIISLCDKPFNAAYIDSVNFSKDDENPIFDNIKIRFDILTDNISCDLFPTFCYVIESEDKDSNVMILLYANTKYYKNESFDKFVEMYKKNFYDILQL